eukprot:2390008-Amphidinium_carterae.2
MDDRDLDDHHFIPIQFRTGHASGVNQAMRDQITGLLCPVRVNMPMHSHASSAPIRDNAVSELRALPSAANSHNAVKTFLAGRGLSVTDISCHFSGQPS